MNKKIGIVVAAVFAVAIVFAGVRTFACDGSSCKTAKASTTTADNKSCCPSNGASGAAMTSTGSCASSGSKAAMASDSKTGHSSCASKASASSCAKSCGSKDASKAMTHSGCGSTSTNAAYAANVYEVRDGHKYAVCNGKTFEVTETSPYAEVGTARYYFADEASKIKCAEKMKSMAADLDQEAVSLATVEGNVTTDKDGHKYAVCPVTNDKFMVTADSPAKVMDGQKYYVCSDKCASQFLHTADNPQAN